MPKKGENIYRRKDGRWEGRYIKGYHADGKARYGYVYGKTYSEVKQKLIDDRIAFVQGKNTKQCKIKYSPPTLWVTVKCYQSIISLLKPFFIFLFHRLHTLAYPRPAIITI